MHNELFTIGPVTVHGYGLMIAIGFLLCVLMCIYRTKKRGMDKNAGVDIALLGVVFGFIGAKILYIFVEFDWFLRDPLAVLGSEGFVVYGGIITGVIAAVIYCRRRGLVFLEYFDLLSPAISVAQGFGRIGCFLAGCCYGRETDSFLGVVFPEGSLASAGVPLLPTQLFSAAGDFAIMGFLIWYYERRKHTGDVSAMYLLLYSVGRFVIEFFRDDDRGVIGFLSTSQFISIFIALLAVFMFWNNRRRDRKKAVSALDGVPETQPQSEEESDGPDTVDPDEESGSQPQPDDNAEPQPSDC